MSEVIERLHGRVEIIVICLHQNDNRAVVVGTGEFDLFRAAGT